MSNKNSDKKLEEFFKMKAEEKKFEYDHEAWEALEGRLDKDNRRVVLWRILTGIAILLLIGVLAIVFYPKEDSTLKNNINKENIDIIAADGNTTTPTSEGSSIKNEEGLANNIVEKTIADQATKQTKSVTTDNTKTVSNTGTTSSNNSTYTTHKDSYPNTYETYNSDYSRVNQSGYNSNTGTNITSITQSSRSGQNTLVSEEIEEKYSFSSTLLTSLDISPFAIDTDVLLSMQMLDIEKPKQLNRLGISAILANDWSSASALDLNNSDFKYGLSLSYGITSKLKVYGGAQYVSDTYFAKGSDYTAPYAGYWTKKVAPERVKATCNMLEIPVGFAYYFKGYDKNGFNINLGSSSIFMLNEIYYYKYAVEDPENRKNWMGQNNSQHYFSMLNIGIGYQHLFSDKFSINISPYANIPLSGIGHGSVDLSSVGIQLQINFMPSAK